MEKINIAEILKDCPKGMKLYSPIFGDVYLDEIRDDIRPYLAVVVRTFDKHEEEFLYDGRFGINGECMLFPSKENRDWSTFQRPFKDGDIITCTNSICTFVAIYKCMCDKNSFYRYARLTLNYRRFSNGKMHFSPDDTCSDFANPRFATEEEKQKLFKAIKDNGYKWNAKTKTLQKVITLKFKIGDKIKLIGKNTYARIIGIRYEENDVYYETLLGNISIKDQDNYELVPNKFNISTLKPFESRVLVRDYKSEKWCPAIWGLKTDDINYPYIIVGGWQYNYCIPFEGNQHLLGTTDDCNDFYKTWE
jgi:hypothetical protein